MDHIQFKANQTAASYVADGLDEVTQEAFELHMMDCAECLDDVEIWRAIKLDIHEAQPQGHTAARRQRLPAFTDWRMAASLLGVGVVGAAGGWVGKGTQVTDLDSSRTVVFSISTPTRSGECTTLRFGTDTEAAVVRVPGVPGHLQVLALDSNKHELSAAHFAARIQPDGSRVLRIDPQVLRDGPVYLEARGPDGSSQSLGCIAGEAPSTDPAERS